MIVNLTHNLDFFYFFQINRGRVGVFSQVPTASVTVDGNPALNRVRWAHSGREIAVGDSDGRVYIYDVGEVR